MPQLTWSALIVAALAAVAYYTPERQPACNDSLPIYGARVCCERHKAAFNPGSFATLSDFESARRPKGATRVTRDR
jgi:hypothetical protein